MKYLFVTVLGLVLGAALAGAVLYFNPLPGKAAVEPLAAGRVLQYSLPDHVLAFALGEDARLLGRDTGDDSLWEEAIDRSAVLGLVLDDVTAQPAAVASRLMAPSAETDLLLTGVLVSDLWLVTVPGEGTLFVRAESNAWPFLKETLIPAWYLGRPWSGPEEYWPTVGPASDDTALVVGLSGLFRGSEGSAVERYELSRLDPAEDTAVAKGELHLNLPGPQVAAQ
jgi:hypothetical protein